MRRSGRHPQLEGRPDDLPPDAVTETGLDGTAYYDDTLGSAAALARSVLVERGICTFTSRAYDRCELWHAKACTEVPLAGIEVVAADLDRRQGLDPVQFGDRRDLHLAPARGGLGGVTSALTLLLAASNKGGGRGGGDFSSRHPLVGSWAGDRVCVLPVAMATDVTDISPKVREVLEGTGGATYVRDEIAALPERGRTL